MSDISDRGDQSPGPTIERDPSVAQVAFRAPTEGDLVWLLRESFDADELDPGFTPHGGWHDLSISGRPRGWRSR